MNQNLPPSSSFAVVVNDDATQLMMLCGLLRKAGIEPRPFTAAETALAEMSADKPPALIITDLYMPGLDGWRFCRLLQSPEYAAFNRIPILVVSATFAGAEADRIAADLGAEAFLSSPVDGQRFCEQVWAILNGERLGTPIRALIVEDNKAECDVIKKALEANGYQADTADTSRAAMEAFKNTPYDVAVLAYHLPDSPGDALLDTFHTERPGCVCLMMTRDTSPGLALDWMKRGAAAYLRKPFAPEYLIELCAKARRERALLRVQDILDVRTRELRESEEQYRQLFESASDALFLIDTDTQLVLEANKRASELYGYSQDELLTMKSAELSAEPEETQRRIEEAQTILDRVIKIPLRLHRKKDGTVFPVEITARTFALKGRTDLLVAARDITDRKFREDEREATARLLMLVNSPTQFRECMSDLTAYLQSWSGCEAVGIRLRDGDDFPYYETRGFPAAFVQAESHLCSYCMDGTLLRDDEGNPVLDCMCGNVLCGRFDPSLPFFSEHGSFWSNCTTDLLATTAEADRQARTRNRCNGEGYESVALIPLRSGERAIGLLQFNDHRRDRFTPERIAHFERMADNLAITLSRRQTMEALRESEARLELAQHAAKAGTWNWNIATGRIEWSIHMFNLFGRDPLKDSASFDLWRSVIHPDDVELAGIRIDRALKNRTTLNSDYRVVLPDGQIRWINAVGEAQYDGQGQPFRMAGICVDITDRKQAEEALRESEEKFAKVFRDAPVLIAITELINGTYVDVNEEALRISEFTREEVIGHTATELGWISEADSQRILREVQIHGSVHGLEMRFRSKNGTVVEGLVNGEQILIGKKPCLLTASIDVTARKRAEEALRESEAHVQKKLQSILSPDEDIGPLELADIIDVGAIQHLMDELYEHTHVLNAILDLKGNILVQSGWQNICANFHRVHPGTRERCIECDTELSQGVQPGTFKTYRCKNNLWDCVTPLMVGGRHVGNLFTGQFFLEGERPDDSVFLAQAAQFGFDEKEYMAALRQVPVWSKEKISTAFGFYVSLANMITSLSHGNIVLAKLLEERKRAEEERRQNEERFRAYFEESQVGLAITSPDKGWIKVNNYLTTLLGYSFEEFRSCTWAELTHPEDLDADVAQFHRVFSGEIEGYSLDKRFLHKSGQTVWVNLSVHCVRKEDQSIDYFIAVLQDITERKRAEEALRQSEEQHRSILQTAMDGFWRADNQGRLLEVNETYCRMSGYSARELLSMRISDVEEVETEAETAAHMQILMACGEDRFETRHRRKDGSLFDVEISVQYRPAEGGRLVAFIQDITGRKRAAEEKARLESQLHQAQKMESVGRLAGGVAHDFNNMLSVILGHTELVMEQMDPREQLHADLAEVRKAAERSADLTRQLLAFARKQTVAPKVLDLNEALAGMLKMLRRLIGENIDLLWMPGANLGRIKVDPSQIDQVLANLCVNARDAIAEEGKITIETGNCAFDEDYCADHPEFVPGEYVRLTVSDDGSGMDAETMSHLFEPFFTTKGVGEGTGLGLATVYGAVKQNNGIIHTYSEPGQGTAFTIYLPRHQGEAEPPQANNEVQPAGASHATILLVEDEQAILKMCKVMLEKLGYSVLTAISPSEAMHLAQTHTGEIHLLMTDVVMPEMNGRELAKELMSTHPHLRRLFMSGYTADVIAHRGVLDQGVYFIQKPFSIQGLAAKVREVLNTE